MSERKKVFGDPDSVDILLSTLRDYGFEPFSQTITILPHVTQVMVSPGIRTGNIQRSLFSS